MSDILPSEIVSNMRAYAEHQSVTGMETWEVIVASNPQGRFFDDGHDDYGVGELVAQVISNNYDKIGIAHWDLEGEDARLLVTSEQFIRLLDAIAGEYDIANYVLRDGRTWAVAEQCWAEDL